MDAPIRTPSGSPVIIRGSPPLEPPRLNLSAQEKAQSVANQFIVYPLVNLDPFTEYLIDFLRKPHNFDDVVKMIAGPKADHYRAVAAETLKDHPVASYAYIKLIENPFLRADLFEKIAIRLAGVDAFPVLVEGFCLLTKARSNLCKLSTALYYLSLNNHLRAIELYFLIQSATHRITLFKSLYELAQTLENKQILLSTITQFHIDKNEIDQAVTIIKLCPEFDRDKYLFTVGEQLIKSRKNRFLHHVVDAMTNRKNELLALSEPVDRKRKAEEPLTDPALKALNNGMLISDVLNLIRKSDDSTAIAFFNAYISNNQFQEALFVAREIKNAPSREACLKKLIAPFVVQDSFWALKELFIACTSSDDLKLSAALLYIERNIFRSIEIFHLLTNPYHRVQLFSKIYNSNNDKNRIIWAIVGNFVDSGEIGIAIKLLKTQCPGIDVDLEIFKVGVYLKSKGKKLDQILEALSPARKAELRAY